jgi:long-subunit acyl-CoA synthetase (AMP-forming)
VTEYDRYGSAFAYGLLEQGFQPGDKLALWVDNTNSAEVATAQLAAYKIGVTIVTFEDRDNILDVARGLKESQPKGLIFSPSSLNFENVKRANEIYTLIPELSKF